MNFRQLLLSFSFIFSISIFSQNIDQQNLSISSQFDYLYKKSSNYQQYKVINKQRFLQLKKQVVDSLHKNIKEINLLKQEVTANKQVTEKLNNTILTLQQELDKVKKNKNSISFFGILLSKTSYNFILWGIILSLLVASLYFFYRYKNSHVFTKEAKENLKEVEKEFEEYRKKSIVREQKLRRELLDEINKHKK